MEKNNFKSIRIQYYAALREECGKAEELLATNAQTPRELFHQIKKQHRLKTALDTLKVAINDEFCSWDSPLKSSDTVMFFPPVAGG